MSDVHELAAWVDRLRNLNEQVARTRVDVEILGPQGKDDPYPHMRQSAEENLANAIAQYSIALDKVKALAESLTMEVN